MYYHAQFNWIWGSWTKEYHNMRKSTQNNQLKSQKLSTYLISNCNIPSPFVHPSWHVFCLHKCYILTRDVHKVNNWHTRDFFHLDKPGHRISIVPKYVHIHKLKKELNCSLMTPKTEVRRLFSKFFTANILFWELFVLDPNTNVFCRKKIQLHFPMNKGLTVPK